MTVRTPARRIAAVLTALGLGLAGALAVPMSAAANDGVVDNVLDDNTPGTLRYEVENAADGDTITFGALFDSGVHVIALTDTIDIPSSITIVGPGRNVLHVERAIAGNFSQFSVTPEDTDDITVSISGMTISGIVGGLPQGGDGSGFFSSAPELVGLTFTDMWFSDQATLNGPAVFVQDYDGPVLFQNSGVINNSATAFGGGAVHLSGGTGDVTFDNTRVDNNSATGSGAGISYLPDSGTLHVVDSGFFQNEADGLGGALLAQDALDGVVVENSTFNTNTADVGGAIAVVNSPFESTGNTFEFNSSHTAGGAISGLIDMGEVTIADTVFTGNSAGNFGGAVSLTGLEENVTVSDSAFIDNEAGAVGGGMYIDGVAPGFGLAFVGSEFTNNSTLGGTGGGLYIDYIPDDGMVVVVESQFAGNVVTNPDGQDAGGGIFIEEGNGLVWVEASTFSNNDSFEGASIAMNENNDGLLIVNSTFNENLGSSAISQGVLTGRMSVGLSTIVANTALDIGLNVGDALISNSILETTDDPVLVDSVDFPIDAEWTLFSEAIDPNYVTDLGGNLQNTDPQLGALADNGGPTLTMLPGASSPAINRGDQAIELGDLPFDQRGEGFPRIQNSRIDMGAVEVFVEPVLPATGSSVNAVIPIGGGLLLLAGIAAVVFVRLRKN